ncbi:kynurenine/alpha-aminoadipate aminotransferase, mitochondrial isoform X1 [Octopus bimaculoides]|nr:kynurenine/alpha-aminoadipate aminotransferase, mitochondrial isoform X1 [Octopus bimaculoides]|eukprot:XP_014785050.1 PREDICTED: kynurenine/alpha-aminoadipate aminotransferase, mitochondrial-like isoform X1 [Octopus bimaculoides]
MCSKSSSDGAPALDQSKGDSKAAAMNYVRYFTKISMARKPSITRSLVGILLESPPTMISMATGMPNATLFPVEEASFKLQNGTTLTMSNTEMQRVQQYSETQGFPELIKWLGDLQEYSHNVSALNRSGDQKIKIALTSGSQDGLSKLFDAVVNENDYILSETPCYSGLNAVLRPLYPRMLAVKTDKDGIIPSELLRVLSKWSPLDAKDPNSDIPKVIYMVPTGCNPTGINYSLERKKQIYEIARTYDLLIVEDDAYYYLQYSQDYIPSFLSLDVDGRVVRADSFSKLISSGLRCGFITGPAYVIDRILLHLQTSTVHVSGLSQFLIYKILTEWGLSGFKEHAKKVAEFYEKRRDITIDAAEKHLKGIAEWNVPAGGMFLWLKLIGIEDTYRLIMEKGRENDILFVPGSAFMTSNEPCPYIRAAFSLCDTQDIYLVSKL